MASASSSAWKREVPQDRMTREPRPSRWQSFLVRITAPWLLISVTSTTKSARSTRRLSWSAPLPLMSPEWNSREWPAHSAIREIWDSLRVKPPIQPILMGSLLSKPWHRGTLAPRCEARALPPLSSLTGPRLLSPVIRPEPRASAAQRTVGGHRLGTTTEEEEGGAHGSRGAYDSAATKNIRYNGRPVKEVSDPGRGSPLRTLLTFAGIGTKRRGYGARVDRDRLAARMAPPFRGTSEIRPKQGRFSSGRSGFHRRPHDVAGQARRDEGDKEPRRVDC